MNEDFAPFELAVKLKEKGFNEPCYGYYHRDGGNDSFELCGNGDRDFLNSKNQYRVAAPTISQVLKWLREKKKLHLEISFWSTTGTWSCKVVKITNLPDGDWDVHRCESYEDAAIKAIEHLVKYWI